eukprot:365080-Pelagomonas_calceolata.AAC.1
MIDDCHICAVREEVEAAEKEAGRLQQQVEQIKAQLQPQMGPKKPGRPKKTDGVRVAEGLAKKAAEILRDKLKQLTEVEGAARQPVSKRSRVRNYHQMHYGSDEDIGDGADDSSEYVGSEEEDEEPYAKNKKKELKNAVDDAVAANPLNAAELQRLYKEAGEAKAFTLIGKRRHEKLHAALKNT